ncbi:low-temperature-induced cysteine proteinase-like protein [Tanacetum coccineum]
MVASILAYKFGAPFAWIDYLSFATYVAYRLTITQWRTKFRKVMNKADNDANTRAIDSLINFEMKGEEEKNNTTFSVGSCDVPTSLDWRDKGVVTPIKDQGQCVVGAIESAHALVTGELIRLSEQELVDCDNFDHGCDGGNMDNAFRWVIKNGGIDTEADYPYTSTNGYAGKCIISKAKHVVASLSSITTVYFTVVVGTPMVCVAKGLLIVVLVIIQYVTYMMAIALRPMGQVEEQWWRRICFLWKAIKQVHDFFTIKSMSLALNLFSYQEMSYGLKVETGSKGLRITTARRLREVVVIFGTELVRHLLVMPDISYLAIASVLSQYILMDFLIVGTTPSPEMNFLTHTASLEASKAAIYSASADEVAKMLCLALFESTNTSIQNEYYPVEIWRSSASVIYPTSV